MKQNKYTTFNLKNKYIVITFTDEKTALHNILAPVTEQFLKLS